MDGFKRFLKMVMTVTFVFFAASNALSDMTIEDHRHVDTFLQEPTPENYKKLPWPTRMGLMMNSIVDEFVVNIDPRISALAKESLTQLTPAERKDFYPALLFDVLRFPVSPDSGSPLAEPVMVEGRSYQPLDLLKKFASESFNLNPVAANRSLCYASIIFAEKVRLYGDRSTLTLTEADHIKASEVSFRNLETILQTHSSAIAPVCHNNDGSMHSISDVVPKFRKLVLDAQQAKVSLTKSNPGFIDHKTDPSASKKCFSPGVELAAREKFDYMESEKKVKSSASIGRVEGCGYYFELEQSGLGYRARDFYSKAYVESNTGIKVNQAEDLLNVLRGTRYEIKPGINRVDKVIAPAKTESVKK